MDMLRQFYRSRGAKEFLCMISVAEILHVSNMIWLPINVFYWQADFSSAIFLFGAMLLMMKHTSSLQQQIVTRRPSAYDTIVFGFNVIIMLIFWSTINIWLSGLITSAVAHYFVRLILSIILVYYALITWTSSNLPSRCYVAWNVLKQNTSNFSLGIQSSSNEVIDRIWRKYRPIHNAPRHMRHKRTTK